MAIELGTKISNSIFMYQVIGWKRNITFDAKKRRVMVTDIDTGTIVKDKDLEEDGDMNYEDFLLYAMNIHLDWIELIHSN